MIKKTRKYFYPFLVALIILSTAFVLNSCSCSCGIADATDVPLSVLNKANDFIIARTGRQFFEKYVTPNFINTKYVKPNYNMVYELYMPEKPYVYGIIKFTISNKGIVDTAKEISGIPNCAGDSSACSFSINEKQAVQIAKANDLEKGINKWKVGFLWNKNLGQYVWHVLATEKESGKGKSYKGNGREIIIDPNTGLVLKDFKWHIP